MQREQTQSITGSALHRNRCGAPVRAFVSLALALLTGLTLGQMHLLGGEFIELSPGVSRETTRTGMDFYDSINAYLATGEPDRLRMLVQPDFVDHAAGDEAMPGIEAFLRQLDTLRAFDAGARLNATPLSVSGDIVRFTVSIAPGADAQVLGLPFAGIERFPASDAVQIADGRVAERWSDLQLPVAMTSLASIAWDPPAASQMLPAIERITMLSGSTLTFKVGTAHIIIVEQGELTIKEAAHAPVSRNPIVAPSSVQIARSDALVALPGSVVVAVSNPYRVTNAGLGAASALLIRIAGYALPSDRPAFGAFGTSRNDVGVQLETLSAAIALPNHKGDWTIEIGRATFATGTTVPAHEVAGSELIYVEQGTLETDHGACARHCVQTIEGARTFASDSGFLQVGHGFSASDRATTAYRVAGSTPATLLIVTVMPARG
jgi:hypothetical protein